jgi:hypothetical protein
MKTNARITTVLSAAALMLVPTFGFAQSADDENDTYSDVAPPPSAPTNLPAPESDDDPLPPVAATTPPPGGVVEQAGVGGITGYGRPGVLELGGSAGFTAAGSFSQVKVSPTVGYFVSDNLQLSGILGLSHVNTDEDSATLFSLLVEPSYHMPFNRRVFGFMGLGMGGAHANESGFGFAVAPRLGANIMVGRSGVLTPSLSFRDRDGRRLPTRAAGASCRVPETSQVTSPSS